MCKFLCLSVIFIILVPSVSIAEVKTIYASHRYVMGDNDSKNDAQHLCFIEAKRKALEKAGTYISSHTVVKDMRLTEDEVTIYSAALLMVDIVEEEWNNSGANMSIKLVVKAEVDTNIIEDRLSQIKIDTKAQEKLIEQQNRLNYLERQVTNIQKQIGTANKPKVAKLKMKRKAVFEEIDVLEERKNEIIAKINVKSRNACKNVVEGMTPADVIKLIGQPDGEKFEATNKFDTWYYGHTRIFFNEGAVVYRIECKKMDK